MRIFIYWTKIRIGKSESHPGNIVKGKIHSRSGETIAETLVALLVSVLALTMLAGAITTSSKLVERSRDKLGSYYEKNGSLTVMSSETGTATITMEDKAAFKELSDQTFTVKYYQNDEFSKYPVIIYK